MGYVAVKGGERAIRAARDLARYMRVRGAALPDGDVLRVDTVRDQMRLAVDRVMAEGSLYAPTYAALALKQAEGDTIEASFILRAFRSTQRRALTSEIGRTEEMRVIRRISSAFKDVPGGQILGPTRDYTIQLLDFSLAEEDGTTLRRFISAHTNLDPDEMGEVPSFPRVLDLLRREGLLAEPHGDVTMRPFDVTREALRFPAPRSAKLQTMARGETGAMVALAYSTMRGYGNVHPVVGELRVGYVPLRVKHPAAEEPLFAGEVLLTEAEVISADPVVDGDGAPTFSVGYGLCFGHNELKAIAMAILDRATSAERPTSPGEDEEFVLLHSDGIESAGFTSHWKLPHYVTFQSQLDRLRAARAKHAPAPVTIEVPA